MLLSHFLSLNEFKLLNLYKFASFFFFFCRISTCDCSIRRQHLNFIFSMPYYNFIKHVYCILIGRLYNIKLGFVLDYINVYIKKKNCSSCMLLVGSSGPHMDVHTTYNISAASRVGSDIFKRPTTVPLPYTQI